MSREIALKIIGHIESEFSSKFGVPRQSGLVEELRARVIFEPEFRNPDALRGIEGFSHLWLIWQFHQATREAWSPTVRPPRLGGNTRMGVFATRSPFRPNPIGLSSVRLIGVEQDRELGSVLVVSGADLVNGTPILDIKPYLPYGDNHPEAVGGFAPERDSLLTVEADPAWLERIPTEKREALLGVLANDPRPSYQNDSERIYGMGFAGYNIRFRVENGTLWVVEILPEGEN